MRATAMGILTEAMLASVLASFAMAGEGLEPPEWLSMRGHYRLRNYRVFERSGAEHNIVEWRNDIRFGVRTPEPGDRGEQLVVSANAHTARGENRVWGFWSEEERLEWWEAYIRFRRDEWDFRIGKQSVRWSHALDRGPLDTFTPEDRREYARFAMADRILPVWALHAAYTVAPLSYEALAQPSFEPSPLAPTGSNWRPRRLALLEQAGWSVREDKPSAAIWAHRMRYSADSFEAAIVHAYHCNQAPGLRLNSARSEVVLDYRRQHTFGATLAWLNNGSKIFAEAAYTTRQPWETRNPAATDNLTSRDAMTLAIGFDHALDDATQVGLQWTGRSIVNYPSHIEDKAFAQAVIGEWRRRLAEDKVEIGLRGRYHFDPAGYRLSPEIAYWLHERICVRALLDLYGGSRASEPGQFRDNDQGGMELTVLF